MPYPDEYSPDPIGVIGATLDDPDHIDAHADIAAAIALFEQRIGLVPQAFPALDVYREQTELTTFGVQGQFTDSDKLIRFQFKAIVTPAVEVTTGPTALPAAQLRFRLPAPMPATDQMFTGPALVMVEGDGWYPATWVGSSVFGWGTDIAGIIPPPQLATSTGTTMTLEAFTASGWYEKG